MAVTVIAGVASALGAAAAQIGAAGFFATLFSTAGAAAFAIGAGLSLVSRALAPKPSLGNQMRGITTTTREPAGSRKLVYGQMRVGGQVVFIDHSGTDNAYLHMVIVFASHEIESFEEFWFNDKKVYENNAVVSDWSSVATITKFDGSQTAADSTLTSASSNWTSDHILNGMAYAHFKLEWDQDKFPQGVPNITAVIKGKKVYDPRDSSQSASDSSTWTYSTNPALCLRDYLVDEKYGLAEDRTLIDETVLDATADLCDETQDGGVDIYSVSGQKRYTLNGVIDTRNSIKDNIEQLLSAMGGRLTFSGGKYFIEGAEYKTPTVTLDESVVISEMQTQTKQSRRGVYNGVKGIFVSEEKNWKVLDYPAQISSTYATEDGDPIYLDMPLPFVTNNLQAQLLAKIALLKSRQQTTLTMTVNLTGLKLKVGDTVMVTNSRLGYSSKVFEVIDYTLANSPGGEIGVQLQLLETASAVYDWTSSDEEDFLKGGELDLYDGRTVDNVTSLTATEIGLRGPDGGVSSSIELSWTAPDDAFVEYYTVRYNKNGTTDYFEIETRETNLLISGLDVTSNYDFRVQAQNLLGVRSTGTSITNRALTGDTTAPSAPTGGAATGGIQTITAEWSNPSDIDFKHVEVFVNTTNSIPASPTAVVDGEEYVVTGLSGAVTRYFWLKSVDFSGNKSAATASFNGTSVVASNSDIGTGAVDTDEIADDAVTIDKIANTLESTNYVANTSGWRLTTAGDFEAGDGTFRGAVTATSGSFGGTTIASSKIYQGTGTWANSNTAFYLDNTGQFSLKDSLFFNPTNSRLTVSGNITADTITVEDTLEVFGPLQAKSLAPGSITREMLSQDVLDEIFGALATSVGGSNGDYKEGTGNFTTSGGTVTLGTSSDKFDHGTADVEVEFIVDHFFYSTTNYTTAQAQATLNFEVSADGTFTDLTSATKTHTLQFNEYDLSSYYGYTYLVYYLTGDVTKTFTSGSGNDIPDDTDLQFRVRVTGVGTAFTSQTVPFTLEANEGVTGVVSTGGNADTLDNLDSTAFLRSNTNDTFDGDLTITGQLILQGSIDQYNVTDLDVTDKTITVNSGNTQSLSDGAGLIVDRGTAADASITWNETADEFTVSHPMKIQKSTIGGELLHLRNSYDGGYRDDLIIENTNDRDAGITLKTTGGQYEMWIDSNGDDSLIFSAGDNTTNITMELYQNKNVDIGGDLNVTGEIDTSKGLTFNPNGFDINGDSDGNRTLFTFTRNGSASWQVWHNANQHLNFIPNNTSYKLQWNGNDLLYSGANISVGTISSGAITATSISATSLSLSGAFTPTSIAATSTVSGSQFRASYGSESAPAFTFKNDDDTGMYGSAARIHFAVSGDEKIQVQPSSIILYESTTIQNELKVGTVPQIVITSARALQNVTANASIITSGTISNARMPNYINSSDTRNTNTTPSGRDRGLYADFKTQSVIGLTAGGTYAGLLTFRSYGTSTDLSGGNPLQIAYGEDTTNDRPELYMRIGSSSSAWGDWQRIFADDYHPNADKWTTARTLTLTGDVTGSVSWDGSSNVTMTTTGGGGAVDSIANFANNRVITASDADSLNGEANLTFDGSKLLMLSSSAELGISRTVGRTRKIVLWDNNIGNDYQFYGFGVESSAFITSIYDDADTFYWYAGLTSTTRQLAMSLSGTGNLTATNNITANGSFVTATASTAQGIYAGSTQVFEGSTRNLKNLGTINSAAITSSGDITVNGNQVFMHGSNARVKFAVWSNTTYGIGMHNTVTYGGINNDYAMTFQMNNDVDRGWLWLDSDDTLAQGAMALTTTGLFTVAGATRIGFGKSDTTAPNSSTAMLNVNGTISSGTVTSSGNVQAGTSTGYLYAKSLRLVNGEVTDSDFQHTYQMIVDANDSDSDVPSHGDRNGGYPFGVYFLGDNGLTTKTLGSGLVKLWNTGHFKKAHIDHFVGLYDGTQNLTAPDITASTLRLTSSTDAALSSTGHAFQVGASGGANIIMDENEIMARSNGSASSLHLNADGGNITFRNNGGGTTNLVMSGQVFLDHSRNLSNIGTGAFSGKLTINNANYANHLELVRGSDTLYLTPSGGQLITNGGLSADVTNQDDLGRSDKYWANLWLGTALKMGGTTVLNSSRKLVNSTGATIAHNENQGVMITGTDNNADSAFTSMLIDHNASGSTALTADRAHIALKIDMDSSATGGDTSNEHRLYGIHNMVKATGDSDLIYGTYSVAEAEQTAGQVSSLIGVYGQASVDAVAGQVSNSYGVFGYNALVASSGTTINNAYALYGKSLVGAGQDSNISTVHGVYAEVEIDASGAGTTVSNIYGVRSEIDNDAGTADTTITNSFLFYGNYAGDLATSAYGVYIPDAVRNYFGGYITTGDGSTGTAAYGFNGDTNTGMYSPANHELGFLQNGTQRLKIDANGVTVPTNRITFHTSNVQAPTSTNATTGARLNLYPMGSGRDYTIGIESSHMWFNTDGGFKWYEDGAIRMHMETGGHLNLSTGSLKISSTTVIDGSRNITSRSIVAVGNGTTDSTTAFTAQNSSGTTIFRARDDGRVLIPSGYLYAQHAEGIYSTGSIKARGGITNDGGNNLSISSGGSAITFNSKNFTSVGTITSGAITSTGTITTTGGNIGLRRDTGSDGATLRDIEFLNSSAEGTDDRVAIIRANNQGGTSTARGGKLTLYSRKANDAGFNSINLDQLGVLNTGQISSNGSVTAGDASSALGFYVGSTQVITGTRNLVNVGTINSGAITSSGNIDLTSAVSGVHLNVSGSITFYGNSNNHHAILSRNNAGVAADDLRINSYGAVYINLDSNNNNTSSADFKIGRHGGGTGTIDFLLSVSGEDGDLITEGNVTAYGSPSDIRLKENVERIADPINKVKQLDGITFDYKKDGSRSTGLIAQQLLEVLPEVVYETQDLNTGEEHYAVRYGNVVGLLVEAIKEQQDTIESLTKRIEELENGDN